MTKTQLNDFAEALLKAYRAGYSDASVLDPVSVSKKKADWAQPGPQLLGADAAAKAALLRTKRLRARQMRKFLKGLSVTLDSLEHKTS